MKIHLMDYDYIDVLRMSQGRPAKDAPLGVTYKTIWKRSEDFKKFFGNLLSTSSEHNFIEWEKAKNY